MFKKRRINLITLLLSSLIFIIASKSIAVADDTKILINIPSRTLEVIKNGKIEKVYPVGVGKPKFPTPTGNFNVISKIVNPGWENPYKAAGENKIKPGQHNPLGTRWIGFYKDVQGEYGIHGTNSPFSVGKYSSHGCIRMKITSAEDLFARVEIGTPVLVRNYTKKIFVKNGKIVIRKYPNRYKLPVDQNNSINEQLSLLGKYYINQNKLRKTNYLKNNFSGTIGGMILTKDNPGIKYKFTDILINFD